VPAESRAAKTIREIFDSGRPLTYIHSAEEERVGKVLREAGGDVPIWTWSLTEGLSRDGAAAEQVFEQGTNSPRAVLDFIVAYESAGIFHLKDFHDALRESPEIRRRLRDVYQNASGKGKFVVIGSPVRFIPEELERSMIVVELRPPDTVELVEFLRGENGTAGLSEDFLHQLAKALQGLTLDEARYALRRGLTADETLGPESAFSTVDLSAVLEEKRLLVNRGGVVEFISSGTSLGEIGGLEGLKGWLRERGRLFQGRESLQAELVPKGVLIMGIPGCGKSLCVKAIASHFQLPLYRMDMIEIFSGRHGKPEGAFVAACRMMEDMAPAVLWFDEIEMGITSTESSGEQGRIFAFFLTWMQEKARGLFVAATANRIDLLPAEMIRKGRFDEVFFVDLPQEDEQIEIFRIHLSRRGIDPAGLDLARLTQFTAGWTGAEIEQCVVSAATKALLANEPLTEKDLVGVAAKFVPLSKTMKEQISHIRGWAFERAVRASPQRWPGR
jgi:hypothetical protein